MREVTRGGGMRETRSEVLTVLDGRGKSAPIGMCIVDRAPSGVRVEREAARGARRLSARIAARRRAAERR